MKFITNSFSPLMLESASVNLKIHELELEEFEAISKGGESYIQHLDVAQILGLPVNTRPLKVRAGDVILEALLQRNGTMRFYCIQILECNAPLLRSYETEQEEMA